jgi:ATP-independent RNA helicase DbpA
VENLDAVFNYDLPAQAEVYVHRVGRTGRAGKKGLAISLMTPREKGKIQNIEKYTGARLEEKTLASLKNLNVDEFKKNLNQVAAMDTLYIGGGRKEKMRPGDILGALTGEAGGLDGSDVGKIEIHDHFSYVAISKKSAALALQRLRDGRIKGRKFRVEPVR